MSSVQKQYRRKRLLFLWIRLLVALIVSLLCSVGVLLLILSTGHIIASYWYYILPAIFSAVGVIVPLLQWLFPVPTESTEINKAIFRGSLSVERNSTKSPLKISSESITKDTSRGLANHRSFRVVSPVGLPRPASLEGRATELAQLMTQLRRGEASEIYALNGIGGVGKTAIAAEAVAQLDQDHEAFPGGAAWIYCEGLAGDAGLQEIWIQLARLLRIEKVLKLENADDQRIELFETLARLPRLLVALDNVEPRLNAEALLNTLAIPGHTTLLITARQVVAPQKLKLIMLHPLREHDARNLLIKRLQQVDQTRPSPEDSKQIPLIVTLLGGLPLAIEMVAAYTGIQHLPLATILRELKQDKLESASLTFDSNRALKSRFNRSWTVLPKAEKYLFASLGLARGTTFPRELASLLAFNVTHDIVITRDFEDTSMQKATKALANLIEYSLVEPLDDSEELRMHPLLREYAQERLQELPANVCELMRSTYENFWHFYAMRHPDYKGLSAIAANNLWEENQAQIDAKLDGITTIDLPTIPGYTQELRKLGFYMAQHGEPDRGRARILQSLEISTRIKDLWGMGKCYQFLGMLDEEELNYAGAVEHYHRALNLFKQIKSRDIIVIEANLNRLQSKAEVT